jgi:hypothetical protein
MPLAGANLPSQVPNFAVPIDRATMFSDGQVLTATADLSNINSQLDFGGQAPLAGFGVGSGVGRTSGMWVLNITAMDFSSADESYRFALLGSNDVNFGNGNVDLLAFHDFAAASAGRIIATLLGPSLAAPTRIYRPFVNLSQGLVYRYLRCRVVIGGTTPSVTVTSWLSFARELM